MNPPVRRSSRLAAFAVALVALAHGSTGKVRADATSSAGGQKKVPVEILEGTHGFRRLLKESGLEPLNDLRTLDSHPRESVLIVFGKPDVIEDQLARGGHFLRRWVEQGGALLIATDQQTGDLLLTEFGVQVDGRLVETKQDSPYAYRKGREGAECPFVDVSPPAPDDSPSFQRYYRSDPPLFKELKAIATNRPSFINWNPPFRQSNLGVLATLPPIVKSQGNVVRPQRPHSVFFAVGGKVGNGRVLILADHSIFINCMMLQTDTDNFAFARNALDWLAGPADERKTHVLYYEDGFINTQFDVPLIKPTLLLPPLAEDAGFMDKANRFLADLEKENFLDTRLLGRLTPQGALQILGIVAALGVAFYGFYRLGRLRYRADAGAPAFGGALGRLAPAGGVVEQRYQVMMKDRNLYDAARIAAEQFFATALPVDGVAGIRHSPRPPHVFVRGGWLRRRGLRRLVRRLWGLAHDAAPQRIAPGEFAHLLARVKELKAALAAGTLQLQAHDRSEKAAILP